MELRQKGQKANLGGFKRLDVSLIWTSAVDLDLMAFYKTKNGKTGGVYSENYSGGSLGTLDQFPFIQLSGDAGVGARGGSNREDLTIARLDDFEELYICALNFTDASSGENKVFADYDAKVVLKTDRGETHTVALDSRQPGSIAVLCKLTSGFIASEIINDSEVMKLEAFRGRIPGADQFKVASKVVLKAKGDSFNIIPKAARGGELWINLNWNQHPGSGQSKGFFSKLLNTGATQSVDLDLGCLFELQNGIKSAVQPLGKAFGSFDQPPWILHLGDDRSGASAEGENMKVNLCFMDQFKHILVYTYIYEGVPNWASTDAVVTVKVPGQPPLEVPMGSQMDSRRFCAVALLEFDRGNIKVTKTVTFHPDHSDCDRTYAWGLRWVAGSKG